MNSNSLDTGKGEGSIHECSIGRQVERMHLQRSPAPESDSRLALLVTIRDASDGDVSTKVLLHRVGAGDHFSSDVCVGVFLFMEQVYARDAVWGQAQARALRRSLRGHFYRRLLFHVASSSCATLTHFSISKMRAASRSSHARIGTESFSKSRTRHAVQVLEARELFVCLAIILSCTIFSSLSSTSPFPARWVCLLDRRPCFHHRRHYRLHRCLSMQVDIWTKWLIM